MQPEDTDAAEQAHWDGYVRQLADRLAGLWPAMPERLGERYAAFVEHAVQQAGKHGLDGAAAVARYVNLCFVWGPAFHDKPGFEWALGMLAAPRERLWASMHQLVRRSQLELRRMPDARIDPATLAAADAVLLDTFGALGRRGALHPAEAPPLPRHACDLEALELRLLEPAVTHEYGVVAGEWQRLPLPAPAPLRVDAAHPAPRLIGVLSSAPDGGRPARLQLRARCHAVCNDAVHPALHYAGRHGLWRWQGHELRALSWPVATLEQPLPPAGAGSAIAEETSPDIFRLELQVCGLRDEGDAVGGVDAQVWVWPAAQWWLELQRQPAPPQTVALPPPGAAGDDRARPVTRCRLENDGQGRDASPLRLAFEQGLDAATGGALQRLLQSWSQAEGLAAPRLEGALTLLAGRAAFTWGWKLGAAGLDGRALMRLVGELQMQACIAELALDAELTWGGARGRIVLRCDAAAPLQLSLRREAAEPALLPVLQPALLQFRLPWTAELTPLAGDDGALLQSTGPCTGALVGEAGLRPRTSGGSGWEWFAVLRLEAVSLPLECVDPLLGAQSRMLPLLPAQPLLEWRAG